MHGFVSDMRSDPEVSRYLGVYHSLVYIFVIDSNGIIVAKSGNFDEWIESAIYKALGM